MQTPTGRHRPIHPIPLPRPHGPADLGILADDLDHLADMHRRSGGGVGPYSDPDVDPDVDPGADTDGYGDDRTAWEGDPFDAAPAGPIFVDASGRRRKLARRVSLAAIAVVAGYGGLLAVSFAGGPIPPNTLLPVPGMPSAKAPAPASTSVAEHGAPASGKPSAVEHPAAARPTGSTGQRPAARTSSASAKPAPQSTPTGTTAPATQPLPTEPSPTGGSPASTSSTGHGNPTPPGHQHKPSSSPTG